MAASSSRATARQNPLVSLLVTTMTTTSERFVINFAFLLSEASASTACSREIARSKSTASTCLGYYSSTIALRLHPASDNLSSTRRIYRLCIVFHPIPSRLPRYQVLLPRATAKCTKRQRSSLAILILTARLVAAPKLRRRKSVSRRLEVGWC
jgi:hypothetical protein